MTNHELNAAIAQEVMGWKNVKPLQGGSVPFGERPDDYNRDHPANPFRDEVPDYSGSMDAAWQMEEEIERQGLDWEYGRALLLITCAHDGFIPEDVGDTWAIIHASPGQRCRAALGAVKEKGEENVQQKG